MNKAEIEDTYAEAFEGIFCRVTVTADDEETLRKAAEDATATPSIVIGRVEGGIRQDILVKPFTAIFDAFPKFEGKLDMMERVGHCGDGFEWVEKRYGREMIVVPIMVPDFLIERHIGYAQGIMGTNFWIMCKTKEAVKKAGEKALEAISKVGGVVVPFEVCSAGSKAETNFLWIGPTTNHPYCPSLKKRLGKESRVPEGVNYIPEIVINGISMEAVKKAMKAGIEATLNVEGVVKVSAGNYGGKLGKYKIYLRELFG